MPVSGPNWEPDEKYYDCRYAVLREPLGFPRGAEILADDDQAIHAWVEDGDKIVAVGRAHVIPESTPTWQRFISKYRVKVHLRPMSNQTDRTIDFGKNFVRFYSPFKLHLDPFGLIWAPSGLP